MATQIPQAGTRMSLISKADIRYEGVLSHIDMAKSEICLTQVQSFGTEQRPAAEFVAASADKFECIIFKGADIKDLNVLDQQPPEGYLSSAPAQETNSSRKNYDTKKMHATTAVCPVCHVRELKTQELSLNRLEAAPPAPPPAAQQQGAPAAPSPWGPPQQQQSGGPQWGPPQPPAASSGGPGQPYYAQAGGHPSQSAAPAPAPGGAKPQPPHPPPHAGTGRPQPAPAPTVVITPARVPPPPQHQPSAPSAPSGPPGLQQQPHTIGPPATQLPNGGPARPAPQESNSQVPVRSRPPPSYANAAGGGRRGRGRGPPPPGGRGPPPQGRGGPPGRGPGRGHAEPPAPRAPPVPVPAEDFDFEEGIQKFNKEEVKPEVEKESTPSEKVYEKDDFFDQLSCEALERLSLGGGGAGPGQPGKLPPRTRFAEQRKLDIETFGGTGIARRNNFGRGRGGRRGGRGGPRGRGRGPQASPVPA